MKFRLIVTLVFFSMIVVSFINPTPAPAEGSEDSVSRISVHDLKEKMDHGEVLIIDLRAGDDYSRSKIKIKGAIRISIVDLAKKAGTLPKDGQIVTY